MGCFRLLLALAVVLNHAGGLSGYMIMNAANAVQLFFITSGFLIALILDTKYDTTTQRGAWLFFSNRALRIFIPYWLVWLATVSGIVLFYVLYGWQLRPLAQFAAYGGEMSPASWAYLVFSNLFILGQEIALWLHYAAGHLVFVNNADGLSPGVYNFQVIPQAWSLSLELMFYMLAPFLVRCRSLTLVAIVLGANALRFYMWHKGFYSSGWSYRFFPFEIGLFVAGMLSYRLYKILQKHDVLTVPVFVAVTAFCLMLTLCYDWMDPANHYNYAGFLLASLALPFLFAFSSRFTMDRWIGELSYPVYLIHMSVMLFTHGCLQGFGISASLTSQVLLIAGVTLALSIFYVRFVDLPLERWRQSRLGVLRLTPSAR